MGFVANREGKRYRKRPAWKKHLPTAAVRRAIQHSQQSLKTLTARHDINVKAVAKWRKRTDTADLAMDPKEVCSGVLTPEHEAIIVAFRKLTLLPLDDCLYALQPSIPCLTLSSLHRSSSGTAYPSLQIQQAKNRKRSDSSRIRLATSILI
jgi:hypothetical protein